MRRTLWLPCGFLAIWSACSNSDNVSWEIVSNPSLGAPAVQGGIVVTWRYSDKSVTSLSGSSSGGSSSSGGDADHVVGLRVTEVGGPQGRDPQARRDLWLGVDCDAVVLAEATRTAVYSPALPGGSLVLTGTVPVLPVPDSATLVTVGAAEVERLHLAAAGNMVIREGLTEVRVHRPGEVDRVFPADSVIEAVGDDYTIREPGGRLTIVKPPPPVPLGSQAVRDAGRDSYRFFADTGEFSAELPARSFRVLGGETGIVLDGDFAGGAVGNYPDRLRVLLTRRNHHLLILRGAE